MLPLKHAFKLPFHFYGKTSFDILTGEVRILSDNLNFGMISFGNNHEIVISSQKKTRLLIKGSIFFYGSAKFGQGLEIVVWSKGILKIGNEVSMGSKSHIVCFREIEIEEKCLVSWNFNLYDSDFHFIRDDKTAKVSDNCSKVFIGKYSWIGSHVTILKGTQIPEFTIIGSNSLCTGNYIRKIKSNSIIAGNPAMLIKDQVSFVHDMHDERMYFNKYMN
jgi:acetyltransferase-like isoleucine patch superfamily enzyme